MTKPILFACALLLALVALYTQTTSAQTNPTDKQATPDCGPNWATVLSPNVASKQNILYAVDVVATNDVWAVGYSQQDSQAVRTLIEHWNGTSWSVKSSPNVGSYDNYLIGVTVISASDIWAVGDYNNGTNKRTLALHYNGTSWSVVTTPNNNSFDNRLTSVAAIAPDNVWAAGDYNYNGKNRTLIEHWNGTAWTISPSPNLGNSHNQLSSITMLSANNIWVVGFYEYNVSLVRTLIEHWDGSSWSTVASPNIGTTTNILSSISAISANDIWAVGYYASGSVTGSLALWWDGTTWNLMSTADLGVPSGFLGVTALATNDVWIVGQYENNGNTQSLVEHWDGSTWNQLDTPDLGHFNTLISVAALSSNDIWSVGISEDASSNSSTLVEHYNPCLPSPTPTTPAATPTPTSISSTPTPIPTAQPTNTPGGQPTSTPTACAIEFTDVPQGSTFYDYVKCMACRNIIGGYTSGCDTGSPCFKPNNNITRGQLSKIVSNAANFTEPTGAQQFEDVPPGSTFYDFVWRLANRNYVGGYQCGGPNEPCGSGNLPYFRPNGNATRGQISKIVSNAANFTDPAGAQLFEDVPPSHTFYDYIQRLANHSVMAGYQCGGPNEPCNQPNNLPYFRPSNNATRGQTSKIVSNSFFPGCSTRQK